MNNGVVKHIGGGEVQQSIIAHGLVDKKYDISFISLDHGQGSKLDVNGIRVIKSYKSSDGIRFLRLLHPRLTKLLYALKNADADMFYQRGAEWYSGVVGSYCKLTGKKFILGIGHDSQCEKPKSLFGTSWEKWSYVLGLRLADKVIVQTNDQQQLLKNNYSIHSTVIHNCGLNNSLINTDISGVKEPCRALWVGRFAKRKRLWMLIDIARMCPNIQFDVIGGSNFDENSIENIRGYKDLPGNVALHGYVPHSKMGLFYKNANVLVSTSIQEGFPNTFLEAWSFGLPVVSTVDPDCMIQKNGIGIYRQDAAGVAEALESIMTQDKIWRDMSLKAYEYFQENHTVSKAVESYINVIQDL